MFAKDTSGTYSVNETAQMLMSTFDGQKIIPLLDRTFFKSNPMCKVFEREISIKSMPFSGSNKDYENDTPEFGSSLSALMFALAIVEVLIAAPLAKKRFTNGW